MAQTYDLGELGRFRLNERFGHVSINKSNKPPKTRVLRSADVLTIVNHLIKASRGLAEIDDIDDLRNRRVCQIAIFYPGIVQVIRVVLKLSVAPTPKPLGSASSNVIPPFAVVNGAAIEFIAPREGPSLGPQRCHEEEQQKRKKGMPHGQMGSL